MYRIIAATMLLASAAPHPVASQVRSRTITATVIDSTKHKPLSDAVVYLGRITTGQRTANDGAFRIAADTGAVLVMVRHWNYVPAIVALAPTSDTLTSLGTITLRQVKTDDDRAAVQAVDVAIFPELMHFYERKATYRSGLFLTPDDLQRVGGNLFSLIRQKPGFRFVCMVTRRGDWDCGQEAGRGRTSIMNANPTSREQEPCLLSVWDNSLGHQQTLDEYQMSDVLAVEAYPNPSVTPPDFSGSPCAAVMLWIKPRTRE